MWNATVFGRSFTDNSVINWSIRPIYKSISITVTLECVGQFNFRTVENWPWNIWCYN